MADHHSPDWLGPAIGGVATVLAGWLGWWGARFSKKSPQEDINEGFDALLNQMRQELKAASRERNELKTTLDNVRKAWAQEREEFLGKIAQLQAVAEGFERLLRRNGIELPERKSYEPNTAMVVQTTLRPDGPDDDAS